MSLFTAFTSTGIDMAWLFPGQRGGLFDVLLATPIEYRIQYQTDGQPGEGLVVRFVGTGFTYGSDPSGGTFSQIELYASDNTTLLASFSGDTPVDLTDFQNSDLGFDLSAGIGLPGLRSGSDGNDTLYTYGESSNFFGGLGDDRFHVSDLSLVSFLNGGISGIGETDLIVADGFLDFAGLAPPILNIDGFELGAGTVDFDETTGAFSSIIGSGVRLNASQLGSLLPTALVLNAASTNAVAAFAVTMDIPGGTLDASVWQVSGLGEGSMLHITGTAGNDTITGWDYDNVVVLGGGADTVTLGDGYDAVFMDDTVTGGSLDGGEGYDLLSMDWTGAAGGLTFELLAPAETTTGPSGVSITGFDDLFFYGSASADNITANEGYDKLEGNGGDDHLTGGAGDDVLDGGDDSDFLDGGIGSDILNGGDGDDILFGGSCGCPDELDGGDGIDLFIADFSGTSASITFDLLAFDPLLGGGFLMPDGTFVIDVERAGIIAGSGNDSMAGGNYADILMGNGGRDVLSGFDGDDILDGGDGIDTLDGGDGIDQLSGGAGIDTIDGGAGEDVIDGGTGDDTLDGGADNDIVNGGAGNDRIGGGDGDDTLVGGAGGDVFDGGDGFDTASFETATAAVTVDRTNALGGAGEAYGDSFFDVELFVLSGFGDRFIGTQDDEKINGGVGADVMQGNGGNDTYYVDNVGDIVVEGAGQGTADWVASSISYTLGAGVQVERLSTTNTRLTTAIDLTGNEFAQSIIGNAGANRLSGKGRDDILSGLDGNDTLDGGVGADTMTGGAGNDTYRVDNAGDKVFEGAGEGTADWVATSVSYALGSGVQVEKLSTTNTSLTTAIDLTGNTFVQSIIGNGGANVINGGGGADTMTGLGGNDTYYVDNAGDVVVEGVGQGTLDWVATSVSYALAAGVEVEKFTTTDDAGISAIDLTGNEFDQAITGNAGNNRLNGAGGVDTMTGLGGNDTYYIDNVGDVVVEGAGQGTSDWVAASISYTLGTGVQVEKLTTTNTGLTTAIDLTGNEFDQSITGNAGDNKLDGGTGVDSMTGLGGNDTYYIDNAGDKVVEGAGQGTADWVAASVSYTLGAGVQVEKFTTTDDAGTLAIDLTGNEFDQAITGNAGNNKLNGMGGADTMTGLGGNDTYYVHNAGDVVVEGSGQGTADWVATSISYTLAASVEVEKFTTTSNGATTAINLTGNEVAQTIIGNAGSNTINGGAGNDTLTGAAGNDIFAFDTTLNSTTNVDKITDFDVAADTIQLAATVFSQIVGVGTLTADQFVANISGTAVDANDHIIYQIDTGKLFYDSNGNADGGAFQFATLGANLALTNVDFLTI